MDEDKLAKRKKSKFLTERKPLAPDEKKEYYGRIALENMGEDESVEIGNERRKSRFQVERKPLAPDEYGAYYGYTKKTSRVALDDDEEVGETSYDPSHSSDDETLDNTRSTAFDQSGGGDQYYDHDETVPEQHATILETKHVPVKGVKKRVRRKVPPRSKRNVSFRRYIYKILNMVHSDMKITVNAIQVMDHLIQDMLDRLGKEAAGLAKYRKGCTMIDKDVKSAVRMMFPNELGKYAIEQCDKAVGSLHETVIVPP